MGVYKPSAKWPHKSTQSGGRQLLSRCKRLIINGTAKRDRLTIPKNVTTGSGSLASFSKFERMPGLSVLVAVVQSIWHWTEEPAWADILSIPAIGGWLKVTWLKPKAKIAKPLSSRACSSRVKFSSLIFIIILLRASNVLFPFWRNERLFAYNWRY